VRAARKFGALARASAVAAALFAGALASGSASAAPYLVDLGGVRLALDAPNGFADTGFTGSPRLREIAESLTSASNRILLFAITDADLRSFTVGDRPEFKRYAIAVTPRNFEADWVSPSRYAAYAADSMRGLGTRPPTGDYKKFLDTQPLGQMSALADVRKDRDILTVLQGVRLPPLDEKSEIPRYMLSTTTLVWLRGKVLSFGFYTEFDGPGDVEWVVNATRRWVDDIVRMNAR
jgi:hypothetical protein